jgi:sec-independent protein translocase protein TatC
MARWPAALRPLRRVTSDEQLTVVEHLDELRRRIIVSVVALVAAVCVTYAFHEQILRWLADPLPGGERQRLVTLAPTEALFTVLKVSLWAALVLALPIWLYQLYAYVIPAVADQPRRRMLLVVGGVALLFLGGAAFGYFIVLPVALDFLLSFGDDLFTNTLRAGDYYGFAIGLILGTGLMFEIPIAMLAFARLGLATASLYRRQWRVALVAIAIIAAILPGGDPASMLLLMAPQLVLYVLGIWLAKVFGQPAPWARELWTEDPAADASGGSPPGSASSTS